MRSFVLAGRAGVLALAMAALTAAADRQMKDGKLATYPVEAGDTVYKGALVMTDADGYLKAGADAAAHVFAGIADETVSNASGADGDASCRVRLTGIYLFAMAGATQAAVGKKCYVADDNTVALAATTANDVWCGDVVALESAASVWVRIDRAIGG